MDDIFRPRNDPARTLYDAFQAEAKKRKGRSYNACLVAERQAVWRAARDYAQQHGLRIPTIEDVERADRYAYGSVDYGAKLAYRVAEAMTTPQRKEN